MLGGFGLVVILIVFTLFCLIPLSIGVGYFFLGLRTLAAGIREKSRTKKISGYNTILISGISIILFVLLWYWLAYKMLGWEL